GNRTVSAFSRGGTSLTERRRKERLETNLSVSACNGALATNSRHPPSEACDKQAHATRRWNKKNALLKKDDYRFAVCGTSEPFRNEKLAVKNANTMKMEPKCALYSMLP